MSRAGAAAELELYPVQVKLLRYQLSGQRQPNANMFAGMVGSIGGIMSSKQTNVPDGTLKSGTLHALCRSIIMKFRK